MQHARDRIRAFTDRRRLSRPVKVIGEDVNAFLRGWAAYVRFGNSAHVFDQIGSYARMRIGGFLAKGQTLAAPPTTAAPVHRGRTTRDHRPSANPPPGPALALDRANHRRPRPARSTAQHWLKVEGFNRTLLDEWAYARPYRSEQELRDAFPGWLHTYNHHHGHTALKGQPPASRVPNLADQYS
ncbi:hypothetical protein M2155_005063 [Streptomyces sp. SAI-119]|nr:hypothetical protein [Streptomyces sp. SAI-119]